MVDGGQFLIGLHGNHLHLCVADVMLGQPDRAVQLLIASRITAPQQFRADAYKACLLAALSDPENAVNTVRHAADTDTMSAGR